MKPSDTCARVMLDGALCAAADARISPLADGFMAGLGVFETMKVSAGQPVFFAAHATRLERSATELGLSVAAGLKARCAQVIAANALAAGVLKVVIFSGGAGPAELIVARTFVYADVGYEKGFSLKTFPDARTGDGLGRLKTLNYLKNRRARSAARAAGCDDALFLDPAGHVLEGATTNLFVVHGERVLTPPAASGILPGIARGVVLGLSGGERAQEAPVTAAMLRAADEVFVTNALLGVMPVARIDERVYPLRADGVTQAIMASYRAAERSSIGR
jgi:branched-subunit amino acid aminotransferase/4-amino-4-deoxychorismate lyase